MVRDNVLKLNIYMITLYENNYFSVMQACFQTYVVGVLYLPAIYR